MENLFILWIIVSIVKFPSLNVIVRIRNNLIIKDPVRGLLCLTPLIPFDYIPISPILGAEASFFSSGMSVMRHSVVRIILATLAAF